MYRYVICMLVGRCDTETEILSGSNTLTALMQQQRHPIL